MGWRLGTDCIESVAGMRPPMTSSFKTTKMYVPNNMVGAIIGSKVRRGEVRERGGGRRVVEEGRKCNGGHFTGFAHQRNQSIDWSTSESGGQ